MHKREDWVDALKALGMFCIYYGHSATSDAGGHFGSFIWAFHVPLFFFVGGFFYSPPRNLNDYFCMVRQKFVRIIIPYYIFSILATIVNSLRYNYDLDWIMQYVKRIICGNRGYVAASALWFLTCYFVVIIFYSLLFLLFRKRIVVVSIVVALNIFYRVILSRLNIEYHSLVFEADSALDYTIYFMLGELVYPYLNKSIHIFDAENIKVENLRKIFAGALLLFLSGLFFIKTYLIGSEWLVNKAHNTCDYQIIFFIRAIMIILFCCYGAKVISRIPFVCRMGRYSIILCGFEDIVKNIIENVLSLLGLTLSLSNPLNSAIYVFVCFMIVDIIVIRYLIPNYPILYGKR